mmetsp:Transcript_15358/g.25072  ORF Transcript_15358/g.25072 Transcript_15358/m.25072 type:complete len:139 (+) Transcript_15358:47-463(+)
MTCHQPSIWPGLLRGYCPYCLLAVMAVLWRAVVLSQLHCCCDLHRGFGYARAYLTPQSSTWVWQVMLFCYCLDYLDHVSVFLMEERTAHDRLSPGLLQLLAAAVVLLPVGTGGVGSFHCHLTWMSIEVLTAKQCYGSK